ncbi:MAG: proprotein convertase P-domain-containing protein [Phycisphaerales bacterium]
MIHRSNRSYFAAALIGVAGMCFSFALAGGGGPINNPEAEPNESKTAATEASSGSSEIGMAASDFISGESQGSSTLPGSPSFDTFRIRTAGAPAGIYRHRLLISSATPGHTGSIRGLAQAGGNILTTTDIPFQNSSTLTTPQRFNQWYGFGRQEQVFYRISGTPATTAPYTVTLASDPVTPIIIENTLASGQITFARDTAGGNTNDVDMWLYDSEFQAIADAGNDGADALTRTLSSGTYYLAISNFNLANNLASPNDDTFRSGSVVDFPDLVCNNSSIANLNMGITITDSGGTVTAPATKAGAFDVVWFQFVVGGSNPSGMGAANPDVVAQGASTLLTVTVAPGDDPPSTGVVVTVDTSAIGGTSETLNDAGTDGDVLAEDGIFSRLVMVAPEASLGPASLPFTVMDDQGRSGIGSIMLSVVIPPPPNDLCVNAELISPAQFGNSIPGRTTNTEVSPFDASGACGGGLDNRDVYYTFTATVPGFWTIDTCSTPLLDTVVSVHFACPESGNPNLVDAQTCQSDNCGPGSSAARTFAFLQSDTTYIIRVATMDSVTGDFSLVVTPPASEPPANDECLGAFQTSATEIPFNNSGATTGGPIGCPNSIAADVWFRWSAPEVIGNGSWQISVNSTLARLALWRTSTCPDGKGGPELCLAGGSDAMFDAAPGEVFFIQVGGTEDIPLLGDASIFISFIANTGLCCTSSTLSIATQADCEAGEGIYMGDNVFGGLTGFGGIFNGQMDLAIPDNMPGISDSILVEQDGSIANLVVTLELNHPFLGDLSASLSNGSITVPLFARVGRNVTGFGSSADLVAGNDLRFYDTAPVDLWDAGMGETIDADDYRPSGVSNAPARLSDFVGASISGTWTLTLTDSADGNTGSLVSWSLDFNPPTVCAPPCPADFNLDGVVNADDLGDFINCYFGETANPGTCLQADFNDDGIVNADDLGDFINVFFTGC